MKIARLFTLDHDVAEALSRLENQSKFVNDCLMEQLSIQNSDKLQQEENEKKLLSAKIKQVKAKINVRKSLSALQIDQKALNWMRGNYPNVNREDWARYCRSRGRTSPLDKVIEILKKNEWLLKE